MPEPVSKPEIDKAIQKWGELRPVGEYPRYLTGNSTERAAMVKGLRDLAGFLEARPDIPAPRHSDCGTVFVDGTIAEKLSQVDYAADLLNAPVTDDTAWGGHYRVKKEFGPVTYEMIATGVGAPYFAIGDDVRLSKDTSDVAKNAGLAQVGYVTDVTEEAEGQHSYTVHFPGLAGTRSGWTDGLLQRARFSPIRISTGEATSVREAENLLIELGTQAELARSQNRAIEPQVADDRVTLCREFAAACGLEPAELLRQIGPQVEEKVRGHVTANGLQAPPTAPELAASDGRHVTATVEEVPAPRDGQAPPEKPDAAEVRGKAR